MKTYENDKSTEGKSFLTIEFGSSFLVKAAA